MFLLIPLHSSVTNIRHEQKNLIFFLFRIWTDGLVVFISLSHLKFSPNWKLPWIFWNQAWNKETWGALTVSIKISLCSIHDTVVCWNSIEVITYSYCRRNMSVYFWSLYFFFPGFLFPVTQICQSVDLIVNFSSLLLPLLIIGAFIHRQKSKLKSNLIDSCNFLFEAKLLEKTAEVWWLRLFSFLP